MTYRRIRFGQIGNGKVVDFAVQELVKYLKQMDSKLVVDVLQMASIDESFKGIIWVGCDDKLAAQLPKVDVSALDDGIAIAVENGEGYITGTNERSVLLAVYRFLKALGCDWVRPGKEGERIPEKAIEKAEINVTMCEAASYRHRGVCIEGADTYENIYDMIDYLPKVGMNEYFVQFMVPGTFFKRWYNHEANPKLAKEPLSRDEIDAMTRSLEGEISRRGLGYHKTGHGWTCEPFGIDGTAWDSQRKYEVPEDTYQYLAEVNGKRELWGNVPLNTELCYSNKEARDKITDAITEYCKVNKHVSILHFWLSDGYNNHCECANCITKRPADWYMIILNELDAKLTAAGVDTKIVFLIYHGLLWEPVVERLNNPDRFIMMYAPISREYGKDYTESLEYNEELPPYVHNKCVAPTSLNQNMAHLRRWQEGFKGDSFSFDYHLMWAHCSDPGYERCARNLFNDMRDLHKVGLNGMSSCQIQRTFFPTALPFNMMAAALWDENCDYEAAADAYYASAFGEDGALVRDYMKKLSDLMLVYNAPARNVVKPPYCTDYEAVRATIENFTPIIERNAANANACQENWQLLAYHQEYSKLFVEAFEMMEKGDEEKCRQAADKFVDLMRDNEMFAQKVLDVHNTAGVVASRWNIPRSAFWDAD
ncbi:MAG: DUF4838 domain-containing protein [Firmicutes bacterium]|nr:DUF4838 domain-containing protein [Bacillota bacterium]